jgi:hypothetical protein
MSLFFLSYAKKNKASGSSTVYTFGWFFFIWEIKLRKKKELFYEYNEDVEMLKPFKLLFYLISFSKISFKYRFIKDMREKYIFNKKWLKKILSA